MLLFIKFKLYIHSCHTTTTKTKILQMYNIFINKNLLSYQNYKVIETKKIKSLK